MSHLLNQIKFCDDLEDLIHTHAIWSQATFGNDNVRGPIGSLEHLKEEIDECIDAPDAIMEYADAFLLFLDSIRRAKFKLGSVVDAAKEKLKELKTREWGPIIPDKAVNHIENQGK